MWALGSGILIILPASSKGTRLDLSSEPLNNWRHSRLFLEIRFPLESTLYLGGGGFPFSPSSLSILVHSSPFWSRCPLQANRSCKCCCRKMHWLVARETCDFYQSLARSQCAQASVPSSRLRVRPCTSSRTDFTSDQADALPPSASGRRHVSPTPSLG